MKIFISYRRDDSAGHTGRLYDSLEERFGDDSLFMDLSGIESGEDFVHAIDHAVGSCDALVAVIGRQWLTCAGPDGRRRLDDPRDFVRTEVGAALARGTPVFPVLVEEAAMPPVESLPDVLKPLASRQALELSDERWDYDVGRLGDAIEKLGGGSRGWDRRVWLSLAAASALVAILSAAFFFHTGQASREVARQTTAEGRGAADASDVGLLGEWTADVKYEWGATHTERFSFRQDGAEILGTASFLGVPRAIREGELRGDIIRFSTSTQEAAGDWNNPGQLVHRYRGKIAGDAIAFYMQSEGGASSVPVEFTAARVSTP